MGLDISGSVSEKQYHYGYSGIHLVRWLALMCCGLPTEICGESSFGWTTGPWLHGYTMHGKELPSRDTMCDILFAFQQSGYYFPNLMFHSDCDGSYTKTGKVFSRPNLASGNSKGLLNELELLKNELPEGTEKEHERAYSIFKALYELVYDEVKNGNGRLEFH